MSSPVVQSSPSRPWAHVPGVTIGPGAWHTSPVYEASWTEVDFSGADLQIGSWTHYEILNADSTRFRGNTWGNNDSSASGNKSWDNPVDAAIGSVITQGQDLFFLNNFTSIVNDIPGPWSDDLPPPSDLASGQTWHVEYEGVVSDRTQSPEVNDIQRLVLNIAVEGNPDGGAAGRSFIRLVPRTRVPRGYGNWGSSSFGPTPTYPDSSTFPLLATYDFGAGSSSGVLELTIDNPVASARDVAQQYPIGAMELVIDTESDGSPFVGPPFDWDFLDNGQWRESWSASLHLQVEADTNSFTLVWQPPRWRYVYEEPTSGAPGDVVGGVSRQNLAFRPRIPTGGNQFTTATDLDPVPYWQTYHPGPKLQRGGPAFE